MDDLDIAELLRGDHPTFAAACLADKNLSALTLIAALCLDRRKELRLAGLDEREDAGNMILYDAFKYLLDSHAYYRQRLPN